MVCRRYEGRGYRCSFLLTSWVSDLLDFLQWSQVRIPVIRKGNSKQNSYRRARLTFIRSALEAQAIKDARSAFSKLPNGDAVFRQCIEQEETLLQVLEKVSQKRHLYEKKKSTKLLKGFQKYTLWLQNMGSVIDVVVQTQAGIGCPVWAPVKFVLKVSFYTGSVC